MPIVLQHPFELVAPAAAILSVALLPLGPLLIPRAYIIFLFVFFTFYLYTSLNHFFKFCVTSSKMRRNVQQWVASQRDRGMSNDSNNNSTSTSATVSPIATPTRASYYDSERNFEEMEASLKNYEDMHWIHAFIIPNYAEPEALLRDTIKRLANHRNAQTNYVIVLAMEATEEGHAAKAANLQSHFNSSFLHFVVTVHPADIPGESRGKGSNVCYAAKSACVELQRRGVEKRRVFFTVSDCDSAIPELYIKQVEKALGDAEDPYHTICAPPIFFSRNAHEVPAAVRVTDIVWSIMVMQNLSNSRGISFPCSAYSLSLVLAEKVGFWDCDADAIGEDMHMWLKCFFKTEGLSKTVPIFVPINFCNVQTDNYSSNLFARFVQARRHQSGVADLAYTLKAAFSQKQKSSFDNGKNGVSLLPMTANDKYKPTAYSSATYWFDRILVTFHMLEAHIIPVTTGWLMFAAVPLTQFLLFPPAPLLPYYTPAENPVLTSEFIAIIWSLLKIITVLLPFPLFGMIALYEGLHRQLDRDLFRKAQSERRTWRNFFDYIWLPVSAFLFLTLPSTIACLKRLGTTKDAYVVSEKIFEEREYEDD